MATTTPKNPELQAQSQLVRAVEADLKVAVPDATDLKFRGTLLRAAAAQIPAMPPGLCVRLFQAACDVKFPSEAVTEFRHALQHQIAKNLNLSAFKAPKP
jgi:hypothetical protein